MKNRTITFKTPISIQETATIAGPKEGAGPLKDYYHNILENDVLGQKSFESAEIKIHTYTIKHMLNRAKLKENDIDCVFCGDLLDEIIGCNYTMREFDIAFMGLYNACATFGEALILGATMLDAGHMEKVICSTASHFSSAERKFRYPLELGSQRTPLSQWTVTGAGSTLLSKQDVSKIKITMATVGRVVDYGVSDANDMGAAMAPAAMDTLIAHFRDTGRKPDYYDLIATGDLGHSGSRLLQKLIKEKNIELNDNYTDCGILVYNRESQDVQQGGSGTGCCSLVFNSYIYTQLKRGKYKKILLVPTGALVSKISSLQGETIPAIAHAVAIEVL
ncbi:MAG: stage V sporulation protein AD [Clostridiales bacterium]|nr:stage V sporulation protein AD [Clostridiales bacterium]